MRDKAELTSIYNETYPGLCRFLESLLGRGDGAAQDIAQESFLRLCQNELADTPAPEIRFWLFRVARNLALNELAKGRTSLKFWQRAAEIFNRKNCNPGEQIERNETKNLLLALLDILPEQQRSALLLREREEMSYREIALVLNVSESKVKVDIFRARTKLREKWREKQAAKDK